MREETTTQWLQSIAPQYPGSAESAIWLWDQLKSYVDEPCGCTGGDDEVFFSWGSSRYHAEAEFFKDGTITLFCHDRTGNRFVSFLEEIRVGDDLPCNFMFVLGLVSRDSDRKKNDG